MAHYKKEEEATPTASAPLIKNHGSSSSSNNNVYKLTYIPLLLLIIIVVIIIITPFLLLLLSSLVSIHNLLYSALVDLRLETLVLASAAAAAAAFASYFLRLPRPVYLVDFSCYKPPDAHKVTREVFMRQFRSPGAFTDDSVAFQRRMLERSGLGQSTYLPESLLTLPLSRSCGTAREEAAMVMFGAIDALLAKTGLDAARDRIGVLVTNCSLYAPTPSLSAMIVNRYALRGDVKSYNLGGMGCSAGLISIDLAKQLLQVHGDSYALVVSTENMTLNPYFGNNRSMLVTNSLFRMGGAAVLLSNRRADRSRSKYQLLHAVRTHTGAADRCHSCVRQEEDEAGVVGVSLSKDLMSVAGDALRSNITALGPLVLPLSEQLRFLAALAKRRMGRAGPYVPDLRLAFEHFCVHAGGRAVLDGLERSLGLGERSMEPSRMTLYRFGNTSSSSLWYELAYCEAQGRVRRGDRLWQVAFGSGFKCNSAVWRALRTVDPRAAAPGTNPWADEIHEFPVHVPKVVSVVDTDTTQ